MADAALLRSDLRAFADAVGRPMADFQLRAFEDPGAVVVIVAPRQSGKSRSLAVYALWRAFRSAGARVLIVSASEEASRRLLRDARGLAAASPLLAGSVEEEQGQLLRLTNGSEVRSVPASERAIRGWSVTDLLLDEAALLPEPIFAAALPTVAAREGARVVMASSATTAFGPFFDHAVAGEAGSEHVATHRWALADATWLSPSWVQAMRESMSELRFRAEMEGVFASGADALFTARGLDLVTADYLPESIDGLAGPARVMGGLDWGQTTDRSALVCVARLPVAERTFAVCLAHRWPAGAPLTGPEGSPGVVERVAGARAHFQSLVAEANGLGGPLAGRGGMLWRLMARRSDAAGGARPRSGLRVLTETGGTPWDPAAELRAERERRRRAPSWRTQMVAMTASAESKAAGYSALRLAVDQGRLLLPASAEELRRELLMLRVDLTAGGLERVEAGSGHDDLADALQLATWPRREPGGGWTTALTGLADPRRRLPDPAFAPEGGEVVRTGAGAEVPRRPAWASVAGPEVTLPGGSAGAHDPASEDAIPIARRPTT